MPASAEETREQILQAAGELFGQGGFEATSTRSIAERSGANLALIHYHFGSKEGLLGEVLDAHYENLVDTLTRAFGSETEPRARIHRFVDAYVDFLSENRGFCLMVQREATDPRRSKRIREWMVPVFRVAEELAHGLFPASRKGALSAAHMMVSLYGMVVTWFTYSDILSDLTGGDPLRPKMLEERKAHLHRMLDAALDLLENEHGEG